MSSLVASKEVQTRYTDKHLQNNLRLPSTKGRWGQYQRVKYLAVRQVSRRFHHGYDPGKKDLSRSFLLTEPVDFSMDTSV